MGIPEARDWATIQKRYRELAKKYHPDLNPELTQAGNRFMLYDAAYRKLEAAKFRYFMPKK
jgi:DnaJ-class molecular chaperone